MKIVALAVFIAMYAVMLVFPKRRVLAVLTAAVVYLIAGILPIGKLAGVINWNVLMMMCGTMLIVSYFIASKMPNKIADILLDKSSNVMWVTIYMSLFSGAISAFIDNVATVLMVAPVGLAICRKLKINPVPMILCIAVSSNLQGAATLVGDTTSILLGSYADMDFLDFFWMEGNLGMFFTVELGALATVPIMMFLFRKDKHPVEAGEQTAVKDLFPTYMLVLMVLLLIGASFLPEKPEITNGLICFAIALLQMIHDLIRTRSNKSAILALHEVDVQTLLQLAGLFVVIAGVTEVGIIDDFASWIVKVGNGNLFLLYTVIVWGSVLISAFVDNIPYVATMLPVVTMVTSEMGVSPYLLFFGLLIGATLGGNLTPFGASANITAVGMLRQHGYEVKVKDFLRIGVPFTLTAVMVGYLFIWFVW